MSILGGDVGQVEAACRCTQAIALGRALALRGDYAAVVSQFQEVTRSIADEPLTAQLAEELAHLLIDQEVVASTLLRHIPPTAKRCLLLGRYTRHLADILNQDGPKRAWQLADLSAIELNRLLEAQSEINMVGRERKETCDPWDVVVFHNPLKGVVGIDQLLQIASNCLAHRGVLVANIPNMDYFHSLISKIGLSVDELPTPSSQWLTWPALDEYGIEEWLLRRGWSVEEIETSRDDRFDALRAGGLSESPPTARCELGVPAPGHIIRAVRCCENEYPLTSILVVPTGQTPELRLCLDRIVTRTHAPYELLVVYEGQGEDLLGGVTMLRRPRLIRTEGRYGFAGAVNRGMTVSRGQQIAVITSDTLVTSQWLERLLEALWSDPTVGVVSPVCHNADRASRTALRSRDLEGLAREQRLRYAGQTVVVPAVTGACLVIKRQVWDKIGLLREDFQVGPYAVIDYCLRSGVAGIRCLRVMDSFVQQARGGF